jgi:peptidyl-prolyl cis-trans isomerase C
VQCCSNSGEQKNKIVAGVVAQTGSVTVTTQELTQALKAMPQSQQFEYLTDEGRKVLIQMLIDWKLLAQEAVKEGLEQDEAVKAALKSTSGSAGEREQVLGSALLRRRMQQLPPVTDAQIQDYFLSHTNEFALPARIKVSRILFDKKEKAQEALSALREGMPFENYKQQHPQSKIKVDTLWLQHTENPSGLETAAAGLAAGELSDILPVDAGYCLVRVEEKIPARSRPLEEVRESLKAKLQTEREQELAATITQSLRNGSSITINESLLEGYECTECAGREAQR